MKLSSLFSLTLCLPFFSVAETLTQATPTFIEASNVSSWNHIGEKHGVYAGLSQAPHNYQLKKRQASSPSNTLYELILVNLSSG